MFSLFILETVLASELCSTDAWQLLCREHKPREMLVIFLGIFVLTGGWKSLPRSICWTSPWALMLLVLQFIPKSQRYNASTPIQTKSTWILPLQLLYGEGYGSLLPEHLLCQKRKALQSQKFFSSQYTMTPIQTTHFSLYNYHIIMELSLFAKNILLLAIICTTAVPRGRDASHEVHEKNKYIWSSL